MKPMSKKYYGKSNPKTKGPGPNPASRPEHKLRLLAAGVQAELNRKHPEPMSLFHKREKQGAIPEIPLPKGLATLGEIAKAADAMAAWENSDPFAYRRTALHVHQGYLNSREVVEEMTQRTLARRAARAKEVDRALGK